MKHNQHKGRNKNYGTVGKNSDQQNAKYVQNMIKEYERLITCGQISRKTADELIMRLDLTTRAKGDIDRLLSIAAEASLEAEIRNHAEAFNISIEAARRRIISAKYAIDSKIR